MTQAGPAGLPTLRDYAEILLRWRTTAAGIVGLALAATLIFTLTAEPAFRARATLLPEAPSMDGTGFSSLIGERFGFLPGLRMGPATAGDIAVSLLESKAVAGAVVDSLDLVAAWEVGESTPERAREAAIDMLQKRLRISEDERTLIRLRVEDSDPERAAAIANAYLDEIDRANREFSRGAAARTREFVGRRLEETRRELAEAQDTLEAFQRRHGALAIEEQTRTTLEVVAKLQGEIEAMKARREAMRYSLSDRSAEFGVLEAQIRALEERVAALVMPSGRSGEGEGGSALLFLGDVPALAAEYANLLLAVETKTTVYAMLSQQYEQAKIEETRNTPTMRILDRAAAPLYKSRPRHKLNMAVGLVLGVAIAFLAVLALDRLAPDGRGERDRWRLVLARLGARGAA